MGFIKSTKAFGNYSFGPEKFKTDIKTILRIFVGILFIFSGYVKGVDPQGTMETFKDYFFAVDLERGFFNFEESMGWRLGTIALWAGIFLSTIEFMVGVCLLLGVKLRFMSTIALIFMIFFTPLTLILAIFNPFEHCGCFGDAIILSNWETFFKNLIILIPSIIVFVARKDFKKIYPVIWQWAIIVLSSAYLIFLAFYNF